MVADLARPLQVLDTWVADGVVRGAAAAVWHRGDIVARHAAGWARDNVPVNHDTVFALASVSKPLTAAAVMKLVDNGEISLDTPVAMLVPEFGEVADPLDEDVLPQLEALRERVTVRQLLCHTSGLPENIGVKRVRMRDLPSLERMVEAMCGVPLASAPGKTLRYSNVGIGIASRVAEVVSGEQFHAWLQREIIDPMGLDGIATRPGTTWDARIAHVDDAASAGTPAESYNSPYWRGLGTPWGGYFATPEAIARFAASFFPGQPGPLSEEARQEMVVDQTGGVPGGVRSAGVHWHEGRWGLGWEVAGAKRPHWTGSRRSPRTWCHWGQSGTLAWADPARELALAVFANRSVHSPWPLKPPRWAELSDALVEAADQD